MAEMTMVKALNKALDEALKADDRVVLLGQDIGRDEGVFRLTEGLLARYGKERVIDTPLAEAAIVGGALGMAFYGLKPVPEIQFSGFFYQAYHQVENHVSRIRNRTRGRLAANMVIRMPYGGGIRAIEHHSESREAIYAHTPGLHMVIPSTPRAARALLLQAILKCHDPVIFFEPKAIYRAFKEDVPDEMEFLPLGKARVLQEGSDLTLISYGAAMRPVLEAANDLSREERVSVEVIDLMTVAPMDTDAIVNSVRKTGRAIVVHEGPRRCGVGAEVCARIMEQCLDCLEAPVKRITGFDAQFPYFSTEQYYMINAGRVKHAAREALDYR